MFERMAKFEKESASPSSDSKFSPAPAPRLRILVVLLTVALTTASFAFRQYDVKSAQIISRQYPRDLSVPSISAAVSIACSMTGIWLL